MSGSSRSPPIAQRTWHAVSPSGEHITFDLAISAPRPGNHNDWVCTVTFGLVDAYPYTINGMDTWQAVELSLGFAAARVSHFLENGWQFFWERGGEPANPSELVPRSAGA
jgi:hypothetical protein